MPNFMLSKDITHMTDRERERERNLFVNMIISPNSGYVTCMYVTRSKSQSGTVFLVYNAALRSPAPAS